MTFPENLAFQSIARLLSDSQYEKIQYIPGERAALGAEWTIVRASIFKNEAVLLRGSRLCLLYRKIFAATLPKQAALADIFFRCEIVFAARMAEFLDAASLSFYVGQKLISAEDTGYRSNFRFVPIDQLLLACSPVQDYGRPNWVYFGSDTVMFRELIASQLSKPVGRSLEIGCGTGFLSVWLAARSGSVTSTDINPQALATTRANAAMNGVANIEALESDVYSGVKGRFDVIISNPPYMFLPEEKSSLLHAYGGHFGMDISRRILLGLDAYLSKTGVSFIFSDSYILEDGTDTLCELLVKILGEQCWHVTATQIDYQIVRGDAEFYRLHKVRFAIRYFVTIRRASSFVFSRESLGIAARTVQRLKLLLARS